MVLRCENLNTIESTPNPWYGDVDQSARRGDGSEVANLVDVRSCKKLGIVADLKSQNHAIVRIRPATIEVAVCARGWSVADDDTVVAQQQPAPEIRFERDPSAALIEIEKLTDAIGVHAKVLRAGGRRQRS